MFGLDVRYQPAGFDVITITMFNHNQCSKQHFCAVVNVENVAMHTFTIRYTIANEQQADWRLMATVCTVNARAILKF